MIEPRPGVPVPPDDLLLQWITSGDMPDKDLIVAAAWGADEQLRLCVEWLARNSFNSRWIDNSWATELESAMRPEPPKPLTLKEQALSELEKWHITRWRDKGYDTIRRALETLP